MLVQLPLLIDSVYFVDIYFLFDSFERHSAKMMWSEYLGDRVLKLSKILISLGDQNIIIYSVELYVYISTKLP